ncbi:hypothetical protein LguiA_033443 [Lonicera macranthoides]
MAIVSSQEAASSSTFGYNYQVFLSFRGEDTRKTFTDHLYTALVQAGLRTFRDDDDIERGKRIELELGKAIQESRISIIVFSKNYASSKWCLDEVVMILEWSRSGSRGHEVLPIFYDVDPLDVRNQTRSVGEAFARYEKELIDAEIDNEKKKELMEKVKSWKLALRDVANLTGMVLHNQANGHEAKFIQEIIKEVERKLNRVVLWVARRLVGMHSRVKNIDSWVQSSSSSEDILVICGMGGIGKTTIAKFVYNLNFQRFDGSSFLALVKEESKRSNGLVKLQKQLLSNILKGKKQEIYNVDEGISKINKAICCKRVLIVIDDVDDMKQLDALLGKREFHSGSKIIITTRNKSLLTHEIHKLYTVENLSPCESLELFCQHAFGKERPDKGYEDQSEMAVRYCEGLPLACEILGSSLAKKSTNVWASTLEKLKVIPETGILNVLKISFDSLQDDHDRNLFLHIACFFVGHEKDETIKILEACDFFPLCGIQNLINRCLISINCDNKLMMHQLLQDMGRQIVNQESPNEPGRRSRLWHPKDSFTVVHKKVGTKTIEGLVLDMQMYKDDACNDRKGKKSLYDEFCGTYLSSNQGSSFRRCYFNFLSSEPSLDVDFNYDAFSRMDKLKLLKLNYAKLSGRCEMFPKGLRWLCWHGFPLKSIPYDFPLGNIVSVDMSYSKLEHAWTGNKVLASLKILNLSHSQRLIKTPNFKGLPNLERLILEGCVCLVEVSDTIENLERLDLLNLKNCKSLKKFPNIGMIKSLQTLVLDACSNIREFPMDLMNMESLKVLNANGVRVTINPLISTRRDHVKLCHTFFQSWVSKPILKNPEDIHVSFPCSLVKLSLRNCDLSDNDFPLDFSNLSRLEMLDLSHNNFLTLPQCIGSLRKLSNLYLTSCKELHSISGLPKVTFLEVSKCSSLESVADQSPLTRLIISPSSCGKLREIKGMFKLEPMEKVNREILDNLGLYGVELIGNLSTFLRREEIPSWCGVRNDNKGSSSSSSSSGPFVVPSNPTSLRIRGLNVYSVYTFSNVAEIYDCSMLFTIINNKSKDLKWIYNPVAIAIPEKGKEEEEFVWLSHWKLGNHLESGDEVDVSVISISDGLEVKEFGVNFVWGEEEEEEMKASHHRNNTREVIGGELSNYQFMRPGAFLLCNHYYSYIYSWGSKSRFQELFGDHTTLEGKPNLSSKNVETERKVDDRINLMHSDSSCFRPTCNFPEFLMLLHLGYASVP